MQEHKAWLKKRSENQGMMFFPKPQSLNEGRPLAALECWSLSQALPDTHWEAKERKCLGLIDSAAGAAKRMWAVLRFLGLYALILFCEWTATFFVLTAPQHAANVWAAGAYEGFWTGAGARRLLAQAVAGGGLAEFARRVLLETAAGGGVGGTAPAFAFTEAGTWAVNSATTSVVYGMVDSHALMVRVPVPTCLHLLAVLAVHT